MCKFAVAVLIGSLALMAAGSYAAPRVVNEAAVPTADGDVEMTAQLRTAVLLAKAAGGGVSFVGAVLAPESAATPAEVAIIQPVPIEKMKAGEIIMFVKDECRPSSSCVMARRITEKRGDEVATERYGRPDAGPAKSVNASVVGRIAYVVDLKTGHIRDMRRDATKEVSLVEALRRESKRWHYVGNLVRPRPYRI
jgi:hypothetical protein